MVKCQLRRVKKPVLTGTAFVLFTGITVTYLSVFDETNQKYNNQVLRHSPVKICPQEVRQQYLQRKCGELTQFLLRPQGTRLLIDDVTRLVQCVVPKAASTTWDYIVSSHVSREASHPLLQYLPKLNVTRGELKKTKTPGVQQKFAIKGWPGGYPEYREYTKFMVIRHPFSRLLASYKLISGKVNTTKHSPLGPQYTQQYFNDAYKLHNDTTKLTFPMYLESVLNEKFPVSNDMHWRSFTMTCNPCAVDYDYIIRTETMSVTGGSDAAGILQLLGYADFNTNSLKLNSRSILIDQTNDRLQSSDRQGCWQYMPEFMDIAESLYQRVLTRYHLDMELFGYKFNRDTSIAYCELTLNDAEVCC